MFSIPLYFNYNPNVNMFFGLFQRSQYTGKGGLETYQFADYMGFLLDAQFIKYKTESDGDIIVEITPLGLNFLTYIKGQYPSTYNSKPY